MSERCKVCGTIISPDELVDNVEQAINDVCIKSLRFVMSDHDCVGHDGGIIKRGTTYLRKTMSNGAVSRIASSSELFGFFVKKHTTLTIDQARRGLCNHGLLSTCEKCRDIF